ncbi:MAG TPA: extracellular solute-binding protein [Tepidisphaeraceae bacterium]|jgi:iron(III) transport system substrate-binding protein
MGRFFLIIVLLISASGCRKPNPAASEVVLYTSVDEPFVRPLIERFTRETGITVKLVTDAEATKTSGLAEKLLAEKDHPAADVYWGNEPFHTINLSDAGVLAPYPRYHPPGTDQIADRFHDPSNIYTSIGLRARMIVISKRPEFAALTSQIKTLKDLANPALKGRIGISNPGFGTASGHVAALYLHWGDARTDAWLKSLRDNGVHLLGGNSVVADQVAAGTLIAGLTDNDDIANSVADGQPIQAVVPDQDADGTLLIPTTIALVKGAPHDQPAKRLIDFLTTPQVETELINRHFIAYSARAGGTTVKSLQVDYSQVAHRMHDAVEQSLRILQDRGKN